MGQERCMWVQGRANKDLLNPAEQRKLPASEYEFSV